MPAPSLTNSATPRGRSQRVVAELLRVDPQTVYNWLDRGELASVRVGKRRRRIRQADLDAFIAAGFEPARAESQEAASDDSGSGSTHDARDGASHEPAAVLEGVDRVDIVRALDALSEAAQTLADQLRPADAGESDSSPLEGHELPAIPVTASPTPRRRRA